MSTFIHTIIFDINANIFNLSDAYTPLNIRSVFCLVSDGILQPLRSFRLAEVQTDLAYHMCTVGGVGLHCTRSLERAQTDMHRICPRKHAAR